MPLKKKGQIKFFSPYFKKHWMSCSCSSPY